MGDPGELGMESGSAHTHWPLLTCDDHMSTLKPCVQGHDGVGSALF